MVHSASNASSPKTIAILGGYGRAGKAIAHHLLKETNVRIVLIGRNAQRASEAADELNAGLSSPRVSGLAADIRNEEALKKAFQDADIALVCVRTVGFVETVVKTAVETKTDLLDITLNPIEIGRACDRWKNEILKQDCCFITEAGIIPGMPSTLVAYAAAQLNGLKKVAIGELMRQAGWNRQMLAEFLEDLHNLSWDLPVYYSGAWRKPRKGGKKLLDFGPPFGLENCYPYGMPELRELPERFGLEELGMYSASFGHWVIDTVFMFIFLLKIGRRGRGAKPAAHLLDWAFRRYNHPPYDLRLKLDAEDANGRRLELILAHSDGYEATAIPVVACLLQWLDGSIRKPGVWMMGHAVEPQRLMADSERMGMQVAKKQA